MANETSISNLVLVSAIEQAYILSELKEKPQYSVHNKLLVNSFPSKTVIVQKNDAYGAKATTSDPATYSFDSGDVGGRSTACTVTLSTVKAISKPTYDFINFSPQSPQEVLQYKAEAIARQLDSMNRDLFATFTEEVTATGGAMTLAKLITAGQEVRNNMLDWSTRLHFVGGGELIADLQNEVVASNSPLFSADKANNVVTGERKGSVPGYVGSFGDLDLFFAPISTVSGSSTAALFAPQLALVTAMIPEMKQIGNDNPSEWHREEALYVYAGHAVAEQLAGAKIVVSNIA